MAGFGDNEQEALPGSGEAWCREFIDQAPDLIQCVDREGKFIFVNETWLATLNYTAQEVDAISLQDIIHPSSMEHCMAVFQRVLNGESQGTVEAVFMARDGTPVPVEGSVGVKLDKEGRFVHTRGIFRDVAERKNMEASLLAAQAENRALLDAVPDLMFLFSDEGYLLDYKAERDSDLLTKPGMFMGKHVLEVLPPDLAELTLDRLARLFESGKVQHYEYLLAIAGEQKLFESRLVPCGDDRALAIVRDITERRQIENELREREEKYRSIIAVSNTGAWEYHLESGYIWCSPEYFTMLGRQQEDYALDGRANLQEVWLDLLHPEDREQAGQRFKEYLENGSRGMYDNHFRMRHADGSWVWVWSRGQTLRHPDGSLTDKTVGTHINITANKLSEEELLALKNFNERIVRNIQEGIIISNLQGVATFANQALLDMLGYSEEEFIGRHWSLIVPPEQHAVVQDADRRRIEGLVDRYELTLRHRNGSLIPVQVSGNPNYDHRTGEVTGTLAVLTDLSAAKKAQEMIRDNEEWLRLMTRNIEDVVLETDAGGNYTYVSESSEAVIGFSSSEMLGRRALDFVHPGDVDKVRTNTSVTLESDKMARIEFRYKHRTSGFIWVEGVGRVYRNSSGQTRILITIRDISERKKAEEALLAEQNEKALILNNLAEQVAFLDPDLRIIWVNSKVIERHDLYNIDFRGQKCYELYHQLDEPCPDCPILVALKTGEAASGIHKSPDNCYWHVTGIPVREQNGDLVGVMDTAIEITELVEAQESFKASENKYRSLTEMMNDVLWTIDLDFNITYISPSIEKLLGFSVEERMQQTVEEMMPPEALRQTLDRFAEELASDKGKDPGRHVTLELDFYHKDGSVRCLETTLSFIRDAAGVVVGLHGISRDVTERKKAEENLRLRLQYEHLLSQVSALALNVENLDHFLEQCLSILGQGLALSRVYLFEHNHDLDTMDNTHEWCAEGIASEQEKLQGIPVAEYQWWFEFLSRGELICFSDTKEVPDPGARELLASQGIISIIVAPLFLDGRFRGFIGFDDCSRRRQWQDEDVTILTAICRIIDGVNQRLHSKQKLLHMSYHDQLTGLYNRHFLEEEMRRLDRERQLPISVIMADLNGLKLVNDSYGHQAGDEMLRRAAEILRSVCRADDLLARFGGDEFVFYLPHTPKKEALIISERIEKACRKEMIKDVPLSLSTGFAVKTKSEQELADLLREAEDNMYRSKLTESRSGKSVIVSSLLQTLAAKSFETEAHTRNMQEAARSIGEKLLLPYSELHRLQLLITLHDIGKINIPEEILTEKGVLAASEWEIMKKHSETGYRIAKGTDSFAHVAEDILAHHERWDGSGYPQGLQGEEIPLLARITTLVDAFEVMSNGRPYKKAMSKGEIVAELRRCSGSHFDPQLVELFLEILGEKRMDEKGPL